MTHVTMDPMVLSSFFCRHVGHDLQIWGNSCTFFLRKQEKRPVFTGHIHFFLSIHHLTQL